MKTRISVFAAALAAIVLLGTNSAFAAGTPAGTVITNTAKMTYQYLSGTQDSTEASAAVIVEKVPGVALSPAGTLQYSTDRDTVYFAHTVTNTGNGIDTFTVAASDTGWASILIDANNNGTWDVGENTVITSIENLAADATYKILVRVIVPQGVPSNILDTIRTTVTSNFVDSAGVVYDTASAWVRDSVLTKTADIVLDKTSLDNTPKPGENVTYTITFNNQGTGSGKSAYLRDTLSTHLTFVSATVNSGGGTASLITGGLGENIVEWVNIGNAGSVYGGMTGSLTVVTTVNDGTPQATEISNRAYMVYTDSIGGFEETPRGGPKVVIVDQDVDWTIAVQRLNVAFSGKTATDSVDVTQAKYYKIKIVNAGNDTDAAAIGRVSSLPLTWTLFLDTDRDGVYDDGTDTPFSLGVTTGDVIPNDSVLFIAVDTVGQSVADRSLDSARYIVSQFGGSAQDTGYTVTRIKAPVMVLQKSVVGASGRSRPGDTLIYTITYTNTGSGSANSIVITDASPTNTTYLSESVRLDNSAYGGTGDGTNYTAMTDGVNADPVTVSSGTVTVSLGTVGSQLMGDATYRGKIQFKVKID